MWCIYMLVINYVDTYYFFFFKQKTAYEMRISDWSSDVCSSDLVGHLERRTADDLRRLDRLLDHARPAVIPCARVLRTTGAPDLVIVRPHQVAAGFAAE